MHGHLRVERVVLEDHRDVALARGNASTTRPPMRMSPAGHRLEAGEQAQGRRLARAGRAHEHHELTVSGRERELAHGLDGVEALGLAARSETVAT